MFALVASLADISGGSRERIGVMYRNRPARVDGVLALSAGAFVGVIVWVTSGSVWQGIFTGTAVVVAFALARVLIRG